MNARMKQQGGWAGSFVIVGILLALLLVGGVYFLKSNEVKDGEIAVDTSPDEVINQDDERKDTDREANNDANNRQSSDEEQQNSENMPTTGHEVLPQTGPADAAASMVALGLLTYSTVVYVRSRRHVSL